ncbi:DUF551 domain-containing protein [Yersinia enterocolitica]|uniref:DUF551 domain-containing protein n=1 Tax=Yersinia TaxID=629 RepID=UPI00094B934F|nr:DUF551 domain-containing protein [Yersinia enterocolitica]
MWISVKEKVPEQSGWILVSTNHGIGFAFYNQANNEVREIRLADRFESSATIVLHWQPLPQTPEGDIDPNGRGFQRQVRM